MALVAGQDTDLRGVPDARGDFAGEDGGDEFLAAGFVKHERCARHELPATGKQNDVLEKFQRAGAAAVLVVDLAIDVIRVGQIDQLGARFEVAVIPAVKAHARRGAGLCILLLVQIQQHELARVEVKALVEQRRVHGAAEGHQLRFDARKVRDGAHGEQHFFKKAPADGVLREFGRDVQAADQPFLFLEHVEGIPGGNAVFEGDAAGERMRVQEALDELERAAVVPMQFVAPVPRFFFEERLNLTDGGLSQINDVHEGEESHAAPVTPSHHKGSEGDRGSEGKRGDTTKRVPARSTGEDVLRCQSSHLYYEVEKSGVCRQ